MTSPTGVYGTDISYTHAVISSLPVIGVAMGIVNLPYLYASPCCGCKDPHAELELESQKIQKAMKPTQQNALGLIEVFAGSLLAGPDLLALCDRTTLLTKTEIVYSTCGLIANLLTLALSISLYALGILTGYPAIIAICVSTIFSLMNAAVLNDRVKTLDLLSAQNQSQRSTTAS